MSDDFDFEKRSIRRINNDEEHEIYETSANCSANVQNSLEKSKKKNKLENLEHISLKPTFNQILLFCYILFGTGVTYSIMTIASSIIQGKFGLSLLEASNMVSLIPIAAIFSKVCVMFVVIYRGKRGLLMIIASFLVFFGFWSLYTADKDSYYGLRLPLLIFPISMSINDFIPFNSIGLLTHRLIIGIFLTMATSLVSIAGFVYPGGFGYSVGEGDIDGYNRGLKFFCLVSLIGLVLSIAIY